MREMIESGVIRYGEEFKKSMEEGHWDLSKVDYNEVEKSQATLVYGQMNEPALWWEQDGVWPCGSVSRL